MHWNISLLKSFQRYQHLSCFASLRAAILAQPAKQKLPCSACRNMFPTESCSVKGAPQKDVDISKSSGNIFFAEETLNAVALRWKWQSRHSPSEGRSNRHSFFCGLNGFEGKGNVSCKVIFILIVSLFLGSGLMSAAEPGTFGTVPEFSFTDQSQKTVSLSDLRGKTWIANFVFTRCQSTCPLLTGAMAQLQEKLPQDSIKLVSFSVDPQHDTPSVLSEFSKKYAPKENKWFFLTTDNKQSMWDFVMKGFMLGVADAVPDEIAAGAEPVMHSTRFVLVDRDGRIYGYYDSADPAKMEALVKDAQTISAP